MVALPIVCVLCALTGPARADDASDARRHAQRGSSLASSGKCRQAIAEYDKALAILRDPALLFNRAECHRKVGDMEAALEDYKQFLADLPRAPNRADVERRIGELSRKVSASESPPPSAAPAAPREVTLKPAPPPIPAKREPPAPATPASGEIAVVPHDLPALSAEPAAVSEGNPALTLTAPAENSPMSEGGITTRPWFWITVAAVVVAAGVGTFVLLSQDSTSVPSSALGNYKF